MTLEQRTVSYLLGLSFTRNAADRGSFLYIVFGDDPVLDDLGTDGAPRMFCTRLVERLARYGALPDGRSAMEILLSATREDVGRDDQLLCDALIVEWRRRLEGRQRAVTQGAPATSDVAPAMAGTAGLQVFLSYSRQDSPMMRRVLRDLQAAGLSVWIDEGLEPGTPSWQAAIEAQIREAQCMVVLLSPDSKASPWVNREITLAQWLGRRIFPVLVKGDPTTAIHFSLVDAQYVDARQDYAAAVAGKLAPALRRYLNLADAAPSADAQHTAANTASPAEATPTPGKPTGFVLFGQHHAADTWRGVLVGVCEVLAQRHGTAFGPAAATVKGHTRQYIGESPDGMITPVPIPGTDLWVEANQSAKSVVQVIGKLLAALGHHADDFSVTT